MTTADLAPGRLDIRCAQGDDITLRCTFNIDLTGYTAWEANALPIEDKNTAGHRLAFTVDTSEQAASDVITLTLSGADTATFTQATWDLKVTDPDGHAFYVLAGEIDAQLSVS